MAAGKLLVARTSFACEHDGAEILIPAGATVSADHPLAKSHAAMFEPAEPQPDIEPAKPRRARKRA
jgi:hypothetical protein